MITLQWIDNPLDEATFWSNLEGDLPEILGGAFGVLSKAIGMLADVSVPRNFRMADFARWDALRFSKELFRMAMTLAASQVEVSRPPRSGKGCRSIRLRAIPDTTVTTVTAVTPDSKSGDSNSL